MDLLVDFMKRLPVPALHFRLPAMETKAQETLYYGLPTAAAAVAAAVAVSLEWCNNWLIPAALS
jgi:hypothetical protein